MLSFNWQEISSKKHHVNILFTKVTLLFTIEIYQAGKYQGRFAASMLTGDETIMILPTPAG